jgi:peptidylprolyl isomerase/peptidyl-prolyl cis-trans isomerase B (cyclophilin B)
MRPTWICLLLVIVLIALGACQQAKPEPKRLKWDEPPAMEVDPSKEYFATFSTEKGDFVVQLFADKAPKTVNNFVFLARQGFYNDITFHRVIPEFMAQTGDPTGSGGGGPGYTIEDEFSPDLRHDQPGILSMANKGQPNTGASQFFITYGPTPHLDDKHSIFGRVVEGMEVVTQLTERRPSQDPGAPSGDKLLSVEIEER